MIETNKAIWTEWLEDPTTEIFLKYLVDSSKEEAELISSAILNGSILTEIEQIRVSSECVTLNRIAEIDLQEIIDYYEEK